MRLIDGDALFDLEKARHDFFDGVTYIGDKARRDEITNFMADIKNSPTVSGWVSVKDRFPEHGKRYLIYATSGDNKIGRITMAAFGGHFALSGRCAYWKVTHWMPLPEPPKEGKE